MTSNKVGKPPLGKSTKFAGVEEEDDFVLNDDEEEGSEQLEKMKRLDAERKNKRNDVP